MKPAWDQLSGEFEGTNTVIADVDCTVEQALCSKHGVTGYPTIKYWTDETGPDGQKYQGGRDYDSLKKFADETLATAGCTVDDQAATCSEKEIKYIVKMQAKGSAKCTTELARLSGMTGKSMKKELKAWLKDRINILSQMATPSAGHDEL